MSLVAKFDGTCVCCGAPIHVGGRIDKVNGGWAHSSCPHDPPDDDPALEVDLDVGDR